MAVKRATKVAAQNSFVHKVISIDSVDTFQEDQIKGKLVVTLDDVVKSCNVSLKIKFLLFAFGNVH